MSMHTEVDLNSALRLTQTVDNGSYSVSQFERLRRISDQNCSLAKVSNNARLVLLPFECKNRDESLSLFD